jgi:hypothetical protein
LKVTDFRLRPESLVTIPEWSVTFVRKEAEFALELTFSWLSCPIFTSGEPMPAKRSAMRGFIGLHWHHRNGRAGGLVGDLSLCGSADQRHLLRGEIHDER